jgi:hypothetical protein
VNSQFPDVNEPFAFGAVVSSIDEMRRIALQTAEEKQMYIWRGEKNLNEVVFDMWFDEHVCPSVSVDYGDNITSLTIPFGEKTLTLRLPTREPNAEPVFETNTHDEIKRYEELIHDTRKLFCDKTVKSGSPSGSRGFTSFPL